ncbi:MAG: M15 family metallopeptidase [Casimicrobium sp.]
MKTSPRQAPAVQNLPFWQQVAQRQLILADDIPAAKEKLANGHRLHKLSVEFYPYALRTIGTLIANGHSVCVASTYRDHATQETLFRLGRSAPGQIVTNAPPTGSAHCRQHFGKPAADAMDIYPMVSGMPCFRTDASTARFYNDLHQICAMLSLVWGGTFRTVPGDFGHVEYRRPRTDPTRIERPYSA